MRICLISNGNSEHIHRLSNHLASCNHEVHLIAGRTKELCSTEIFFHTLGNNPLFWPIQVKQLVKHINPDIVDGQYLTIYGFLAALSGFHPLVVTAWGSDVFINPWQNPLWKFTAKYALKHADKIACLFSIDIVKDKLVRLGTDLSKVETYYLGVDTSIFYNVKTCSGIKADLGIDLDSPVILNPRGFATVYGMNTFIKAIPLVLNHIPLAKFIILHKKSDQTKVASLKEQSWVAESVKFIEWVPHSKMPQLLSAADVYVSPSLSDGASNALFEAMACEIAPIVTDIPANRPWVIDGENGYLFPTGDHNALAEKIICLLRDKEKRINFGKKSRAMVCEKVEQRVQMAKIEKIYQELIEKYSKR
jgi:L-malate glycosyltransferase